MRTIILVAAFLMVGATASDAARTTQSRQCVRPSPHLNIEVAQQGCCSWHSGVCGCSGGRIVCCDSTYSPSCGC